MQIRNAITFRFDPKLDLSGLDSAARELALKPIGPQEVSSRGFVPPLGRDSEVFAHGIADALWLAVGTQERMLPSHVVNDELEKKLVELEQREGRRPGARARKRLKEELMFELLPRAFVKAGRVDVLIDKELGLCVVDTSSRKEAEAAVSQIRGALGSFPALPLNAERAPRAVLTGWLSGEDLPEGLALGEECELKDAVAQGAVVRCQRQELGSEEVAKHLEAGKQVTRLALQLDDHVSFVAGEDLVIRKLKLLDGAMGSLEATEREDMRAELDARFALMASEFKALFKRLEAAFRFSPATG